MARQQGNLPFSSNFETRFAEPLDARARVELQSDLTAAATWERDGNPSYTYVGMLVSVYADIPGNNGLYQLTAADFSDIGNWSFIGGGEAVHGDATAVKLTATTATAISGHRAITRNTDGLVVYASADVPGHVDGVIGVTTTAAGEGELVTYVSHGSVINEGSWSWTPGRPIYLKLEGQMSQTPPTSGFISIVGTALTATSMLVMPRVSVELAEPLEP